MSKNRSIRGKIWLLGNLSRINLKVSLITLVGLTIGLSMISAYLIYIDTNRADHYMTFFDSYPFVDGELKFSVSLYSDYSLENPANVSDIQGAENYLDNQIASFNLASVFTRKDEFIRIDERVTFLNQSGRAAVFAFELDQAVLDDCIDNSTLPSETGEVIIFSRHEINSFAIGDEFNLSYIYYTDTGKHTCNTSLEITGIITIESLKNDSHTRDVILYEFYDLPDYTVITRTSNYFSMLESLNGEFYSQTNNTKVFWSDVVLSYDGSFNRQNVVKTVEKSIIPFLNEARNFKYLDYRIWISRHTYYDYLTSKITNYNVSHFLNLLIFSVPSLLLAYLLIRFSLGLINEHRGKALVLLKMRGLSNSFIFLVLFIETLVIASIASLLGIILGIPLSILLNSTTGYLTFDITSPAVSIVITSYTVQSSFILGFFFTFISHLRPIIHLARSSIVSMDAAASKKQKRKARIFKGNLDLVLLVQGVVGLLILAIIIELSRTNPESGLEILFLLSPLITFIAFISPLSLLIGFILAFNRFVPLILYATGKNFIERDWWLPANAIKNLSINVRATGRLSLLIALSISFLVILASLPVSYAQYNVDLGYYHLGSDIIIDGRFQQSDSIDNLTTRLQAVPGLRVSQTSEMYSYQQVQVGQDIYQTVYTHYLGIDEDFPSAIHWRSIYDDESLENLVSGLFASIEEFPVIIDSVTAAKEKLTLKSTYQEQINILGGELTLNATVEGIIDMLPGFMGSRGSNRYLITKRSLIEDLDDQHRFTDDLHASIWCNMLTGYDQEIADQVVEIAELYRISTFEIYTIEEYLPSNSEDITDNIQKIITNFNFITSLTIILALIILFTFTRITSHATEIGLSRAFGMKYRQVFLLMFTEPMLLFVISGIPGAIIGVTLLSSVVALMNTLNFSEGPPFILIFDVPVLVLILGSILTVTVLSGAIMSFMAARANISKILKVE
ncbi:MAG: FtsX-like permease family protein [Candidatus Odinarchaeota archaeon]